MNRVLKYIFKKINRYLLKYHIIYDWARNSNVLLIMQHRRLSYSRHAVNDRDLSTQVNYKMHMNIRRMMGEHKHRHKRSKKLLKVRIDRSFCMLRLRVFSSFSILNRFQLYRTANRIMLVSRNFNRTDRRNYSRKACIYEISWTFKLFKSSIIFFMFNFL